MELKQQVFEFVSRIFLIEIWLVILQIITIMLVSTNTFKGKLKDCYNTIITGTIAMMITSGIYGIIIWFIELLQ